MKGREGLWLCDEGHPGDLPVHDTCFVCFSDQAPPNTALPLPTLRGREIRTSGSHRFAPGDPSGRAYKRAPHPRFEKRNSDSCTSLSVTSLKYSPIFPRRQSSCHQRFVLFIGPNARQTAVTGTLPCLVRACALIPQAQAYLQGREGLGNTAHGCSGGQRERCLLQEAGAHRGVPHGM